MNLLEKGSFYVGCNYWASDWGIEMWSHFHADVIRRDFTALAERGIRLIRVFPLWSVFQPIEPIVGCHGKLEGYSADGGATLLYDFGDDAGINPQAMADFSTMIDIAEELGIGLIPSIVTGWMSGRLFAPPAMIGRDVLTDPFAIKWEIRFVRHFVRSFRDRQNIVGWCLGNECNCCGEVENTDEAWLWTAAIANAIRACDPTRPVISGMHGLKMPGEGAFTIQMQGENCDMLTPHPYASPSYKTDSVPADRFRAVMHPACQTAMYRDIAKKPAFIEETGTFGEMYCDEQLTAVYAKNVLFNAWAHDCRAYLWWIGFDQGHLTYHPFGYNNRASNYGLFRQNYEPKPILDAISGFGSFLEGFEPRILPDAVVDGVCLLPNGAASWDVGSGAFYLAKQAGMNLSFAAIEDALPDAGLYILPSVSTNSISVGALERLMTKVREGAVLYMSVGGGFTRNLSTDFGFHINERHEISGAEQTVFDDGEKFTLTLTPSLRYNITLSGADCLAKAPDGTPVFTCADYGRGKVMFLACPIERQLFASPAGYDKGHWRIYDIIRRRVKLDRRIERVGSPYVTLTEHPAKTGSRIVVAVNNSNKPETVLCRTRAALAKIFYGSAAAGADGITLAIAPNDAAVFEIK